MRRVRSGRGDRRGDLDHHRGRFDGGGSEGWAPVSPGLPPLGDVPRLALQEGCCERVRVTEARVDVVPGRERRRRRGGRAPKCGRIDQLRPVLEPRVQVVAQVRHVAPRPSRLRLGTLGRGREIEPRGPSPRRARVIPTYADRNAGPGRRVFDAKMRSRGGVPRLPRRRRLCHRASIATARKQHRLLARPSDYSNTRDSARTGRESR